MRSEYYELGVDSGEESLLDSNKVYYKIAVREHYDIGERLTFLDEKLAVVARVSRLEHREVINEYILMKESDVKTRSYQNEKLIGAVLFEKLSQVENQLVRVSIDDEKSTEFPVNGAVLCCSRGSDYSILNSADHGVYTDSSEIGALANTDEKNLIKV